VIVALVLVGAVCVGVVRVVAARDAVVPVVVLGVWAACVVVAGGDTPPIPCVLEVPPPPQAASASGQANVAIRAPKRIGPYIGKPTFGPAKGS
jgi:hypothetical protein